MRRGIARIVVSPGIYGIGIDNGKANIAIKIPKPRSFRETFISSIEIESDFLLRTTWRKNSDVGKYDLSCRLLCIMR